MPQEFHIWSEGGKRCARLIVPSGMDENGGPANVEFLCSISESDLAGLNEEQIEEKLVGELKRKVERQAPREKKTEDERKAKRKTLNLKLPEIM